jgi:hypothetical protein
VAQKGTEIEIEDRLSNSQWGAKEKEGGEKKFWKWLNTGGEGAFGERWTPRLWQGRSVN